ncbi:hypothetical protein O3P69_008066 [Scylla paramamosain]|uniref:Uncharacterized protein n=1 Tax=Scylla paramamosain TaxID=85552 RepID=A0AAW0T003_SCYPA
MQELPGPACVHSDLHYSQLFARGNVVCQVAALFLFITSLSVYGEGDDRRKSMSVCCLGEDKSVRASQQECALMEVPRYSSPAQLGD